MHRQALEVRRTLLGNDHLDVAASLGQLGCLLRDGGKLTEAETMLREALAINRRLLGDDNPLLPGR